VGPRAAIVVLRPIVGYTFSKPPTYSCRERVAFKERRMCLMMLIVLLCVPAPAHGQENEAELLYRAMEKKIR
jgi:hypothetical protein